MFLSSGTSIDSSMSLLSMVVIVPVVVVAAATVIALIIAIIITMITVMLVRGYSESRGENGDGNSMRSLVRVSEKLLKIFIG